MREIIKTFFKTSLTSACFLCFISFTNREFWLARLKFPTFGCYFNSCRCKNLSIFTGRCFTEFDGYNHFPLSLIFISCRSNFFGDLKITSSVFLILREILFALNQLFKCFTSRLTRLFIFLQTYLYKKDLYYHQSDVLCSIELSYGDH